MQKRHLAYITGVFAALALFGCCVSAYAAEFTANIAMTGSRDFNFEGTIYIKGKMLRMETVLDGEEAIFIENAETGDEMTLNVNEKKYVKFSGFRQIEKENEQYLDSYKKKNVGTETVNGYECDKYVYTDGRQIVAELWVSKKLDRFIKRIIYAKHARSILELSNIHECNLDDALFQIPSGYTKMAGAERGEVMQAQIEEKKETGAPGMVRQEQESAKIEKALPARGRDFYSLIDNAKDKYHDGLKLAAIQELKEAVLSIWDEVPLAAKNVQLVNDLKDYMPRTNNIYHCGEPIFVTAQILGYEMKRVGKIYHTNMKTDFYILDENGVVLVLKKDFVKFDHESFIPYTDFPLNINYSITDSPQGVYNLLTVIHDINSGEKTQFTIKIELKK